MCMVRKHPGSISQPGAICRREEDVRRSHSRERLKQRFLIQHREMSHVHNVSRWRQTKGLLRTAEDLSKSARVRRPAHLVQPPNARSRAETAPSVFVRSLCALLPVSSTPVPSQPNARQSDSAHRACVSVKVPQIQASWRISWCQKTQFLPRFTRTTLRLIGLSTRRANGPSCLHTTHRSCRASTVLATKHSTNHKLVTDLQNWRISFRILWQRIRWELTEKIWGVVFGIKTPQLRWKVARSRTQAQIQNVSFLFVCFVPNLQADVCVLR